MEKKRRSTTRASGGGGVGYGLLQEEEGSSSSSAHEVANFSMDEFVEFPTEPCCKNPRSYLQKRYWVPAIVIVLVCLVAIIAIVALTARQEINKTNNNGIPLESRISADKIKEHLKKLMEIARKNNGSRSVLTGYNSSAEYFADELRQITKQQNYFDIDFQYFVVPVYTQLATPSLALLSAEPSSSTSFSSSSGSSSSSSSYSSSNSSSDSSSSSASSSDSSSSSGSDTLLQYQPDVDFIQLRYGGNGTHDMQRSLRKINRKGCSLQDFEQFVKGDIALIEHADTNATGTDACEEDVKALNAQEKGASGVIIYQMEGQPLSNPRARKTGWLEGDPLVTIPTFMTTYSVGSSLNALLNLGNDVTLHMSSQSSIELTTTYSLFCSTKDGSDNDLVIAGAHLDSVPESAGINDNGSGAASLLEMAIQMASIRLQPVNKVRFAWWGAEELGLLGAYNYIAAIRDSSPPSSSTSSSAKNPIHGDDTDLDNIAVYLNFDMLASPNFIPLVSDGSTAPEKVRNGSTTVQNILRGYLDDEADTKAKLTPMSKPSSDFYPFLMNNIPAGFVTSGASQVKDEADRKNWGGIAGAALDPCYHQRCDTNENIHKDVLTDLAKAGAYTLSKLATQNNLRNYLK
ncbi:Aminopeptidase Y [Balamuthia mandrillaris]